MRMEQTESQGPSSKFQLRLGEKGETKRFRVLSRGRRKGRRPGCKQRNHRAAEEEAASSRVSVGPCEEQEQHLSGSPSCSAAFPAAPGEE